MKKPPTPTYGGGKGFHTRLSLRELFSVRKVCCEDCGHCEDAHGDKSGSVDPDTYYSCRVVLANDTTLGRNVLHGVFLSLEKVSA